MTSTLDASVETERCMFYQFGAGGLAINREKVRYTPGLMCRNSISYGGEISAG
jgi:hypothetical protein